MTNIIAIFSQISTLEVPYFLTPQSECVRKNMGGRGQNLYIFGYVCMPEILYNFVKSWCAQNLHWWPHWGPTNADI